MKIFILICLIFLLGHTKAATDTLKSFITCGASPDVPGFGFQQGSTFTGLEIEFCKAFSTALTGSPNNARFVPTISSNRFQLLENGTIDVITRGTFISYTRESIFKVRFSRPYYWDLGGIVVLASSPIRNQNDFPRFLNDTQKICVNLGSLNQEQAADFYGPDSVVAVPTTQDAFFGVTNGTCLGYINTVSVLYGTIAEASNPSLYRVISLDSTTLDAHGFVVNKNRRRLLQTISWIVSGLILAYDQGITQNNVDSIDLDTITDDAKRLLGYNTYDPRLTRTYELPGSYLKTLSMTDVIKAVGNWGEIFNRTAATIGSPIGKNLPVSRGGLLVSHRW